jgi:GAF domain-containing protein/nitrogen-specific signal transduction histidine kinase
MEAPLFTDEPHKISRPELIPPASSHSRNVISALVSLNKHPVLLWLRSPGKKIWLGRQAVKPIQRLRSYLALPNQAERDTTLLKQKLAESKQRQERLQGELNQLAVLHAIAVAGTEVSTKEELLKRVTHIVEELFYPAKFGVGLLDHHAQVLRIYTAAAGLSEKPASLTLPLEQGIVAQVMSSGQPRHTPDVSREPMYGALDSTTRSQLCVPLKVAGQVVGVLNLENAHLNAFSAADEQLLLPLANQLATALGHINLFELTRRRAEEHETLAAISSALHKAPIQANMIAIIFDSVLNLLAMDGATLAVLDQATGEMVIERGGGLAANLTHLRLPPGRGLNSYVAGLGQLYVNNNLQSNPLSAWSDMIPDIKAIAGAPLIAEGQLIGVLCVGRQKAIDETGVRLLTFICDLAANAIRRATLHEQTQHLLQQTQHQAWQLQQIMDTVPGGILVLDAQQRIMLTNSTAQEYLTVLANVTPGNILTHINGQPMTALLQAASNGLRQEIELRGPPSRVFEVDAWSLHDEARAGDSVLILREISREREIQQRIQAQERLAAVGQLAAGIAHDFNNILTGIIGFAELALFYPKLVQGPEEALERIVQQGHRAIHLIRQILDFSRQSPTEKYPLDLVPLIRENIKLLERIIPEHIRISFEIEPDYKFCKIDANPTQIQQILTNLAVNARDAMTSGGNLAFHLASLILPAGAPPP